MAREFRRITFSNAELRVAIENYPRLNGINLPKGDITTITSKNRENRFFYELSVFDFQNQKSDQVDIAEDDAKSLLIEHCIAASIVLPRSARKETRDVENKLCLELFID